MLVAAVLAAMQLLGATGVAHASIVSTGGQVLNAVACPSADQCTAVGTGSKEMTFDPGGPTPIIPTSATLDGNAGLSGVACPTASQCTAVGSDGKEVTFNPTSPGKPSPVTLASGTSLLSVACPAASQCTAVGTDGKEVTFDPKSSGQPAPVKLETGGQQLYGVACPSSTQCTAVDISGAEVTFKPSAPGQPTPVTLDKGISLFGVACPSLDQCTAVDNGGGEVTFNPTSAAHPASFGLEGDTSSVSGIACPTTTQCTAVDLTGEGVTFSPTSPHSSTPMALEPSGEQLFGVACPSTSLCVAVGSSGAVTFNPSSTTAVPAQGTVLSNGEPENVDALPGQHFNVLLATFDDTNIADTGANFVAQVQWGEGEANLGVLSNALSQTDPNGPITSDFFISGAHTYGKQGTYPITITVSDPSNPKVPPLTIHLNALIGPLPTDIPKDATFGTFVASGGLCAAGMASLLIPGVDIAGGVVTGVCAAATAAGVIAAFFDPYDARDGQVALPGPPPNVPRLRCPARAPNHGCRRLERDERAYLSAASRTVPINEALILTLDRFDYARTHRSAAGRALQAATMDVYGGYLSNAILSMRAAGRRMFAGLRGERLSLPFSARQRSQAIRHLESARLPPRLRKLLATQGLDEQASARLVQSGFKRTLRKVAPTSASALIPGLPAGLRTSYRTLAPRQLATLVQALNGQGSISDLQMATLAPRVHEMLTAKSPRARHRAARGLSADVRTRVKGPAAKFIELADGAF
ncbi:MAG: hypothetical protein WB507_11870 [Solirubrobacterales bacterium]